PTSAQPLCSSPRVPPAICTVLLSRWTEAGLPVDPTLERLSAATVDRLPTTIARPGYDRRQLKSGIVHLGLGAFFRAFGALYVEDAIAREGGDWGIIGASLKRPDQRDRLSPQNGLYTALERGPGGDVARVVGSVL